MKTLFIYGSTGDLVKRKVIPALQKLNIQVKILALGRKELNNDEYANIICKENECQNNFKKNIIYHKNFLEEETCRLCYDSLNKKGINFFYISLPPKMIKNALSQISDIKKHGFKVKILIEKPFGEDLSGAKKLKHFIWENKLKKEILLSDHYLFKKNILSLKKKNFKKLKIVGLEKVGLEGRISYYDEAGALKDMIQSHFLNILFKISPNLKSNEVKITEVVKKQYHNYEKELGKKSGTETYVKIKILVEGKEIEFETGKNFEKKESYILIDGEKLELDNENSYEKVFFDLLNENWKNFPSINTSLEAWKITEKIEKEMKKKGLSFY